MIAVKRCVGEEPAQRDKVLDVRAIKEPKMKKFEKMQGRERQEEITQNVWDSNKKRTRLSSRPERKKAQRSSATAKKRSKSREG